MLIVLVFFKLAMSVSYVQCDKRIYKTECAESYEPVCGIRSSGIPMTFPNDCHACLFGQSRYYVQQPCHTIVNFCPYEREKCNLSKFEPSCAFSGLSAPTNINYNKCCLGTQYTAFIEGPCPLMRRSVDNSLKFCSFQKECTARDPAVCAILLNYRRKTYANQCMACRDSIIGFTYGKCQTDYQTHSQLRFLYFNNF